MVQATDHLNHPACSQGSQAPLLQKEGIFALLQIRSHLRRHSGLYFPRHKQNYRTHDPCNQRRNRTHNHMKKRVE